MTLELEDGRTAFYQWDTGQRLVVTGGCGQIHFCHSGDKTALVCPIRQEAGKLVADVPNILLQKAETILAYAYGEGEDGSKTLWARSFAVKPRPKPEDYVYTQTEVLSYETLADRVAKLEGEGLSQAVADYLKDNPVQAGATAEEAAQIWQNKTDIACKLDASALPTAVENALSQAKADGAFKGEPGDDYVLTDADKQEIAELTAPLVDVPEGGSNQPLTFTGAVNATYDGSKAVSVNIPFGGGSGGGDGGSSGWKKVAEYVWDGNKEYQPLTLDYATGEMTFDTAPPTNKVMWAVPNFEGITTVTDLMSLYSKIPNEFMGLGATGGIMALGANGYTFGGKTSLAQGGVNANVDVSAFHFEVSNTVPTFSGLNAKKVKVRLIAPGGNEWLSNSSFNFQVKLSNGTTCTAYSPSDASRVLLSLTEQTFCIDGNVYSSLFELVSDRFQSRSNASQGVKRVHEIRSIDRRIVPDGVTITEVSYPSGNGNYRPCNGSVVEVYVYED